MKRKILSLFTILFVGTFAFYLVGCGGGTEGLGTGENPILDYVPTEDIEIEFWHAMGQSNQAVIDQMISTFQEKYPNITVSAYSKGGYDELREAIIYGCAGGTGPTIAQTYQDHVALYLKTRNVKKLDGFMNHTNPEIGIAKAELDQIFPSYLQEGRVYQEAGTFSLPFNKSSEVLFYNKDFFCAHAATLAQYGVKVVATDENGAVTDVEWPNPSWEQVEAIAQYFLTTDEYKDIEDKAKSAGFAADSAANLFITLNQQWGGVNAYTGKGSDGKLTYLFQNSAKGKEAIQWFADGFKAGYFATATKFGEEYSSNAFVGDKTIMTLGSSAGAGYNVASDGHFRTGVTHYPQRAAALESGKEKYVIQQGTNVTLFKCDSSAEEMAGWLFIKHLMSYEMALLWATNTAYFPIRKDVYEGNEYQAYINGWKLDKDGQFVYDENGAHVQDHTVGVKELTQQIVFSQRDYMFTNVAFVGSSYVRDEAEGIIEAMLYSNMALEAAYDLAITNIKAKMGQ